MRLPGLNASAPAGADVRALAFGAGDPAVAYAATGGGLYRSGDDGRTWIRPAMLPLGIPFTRIAINPHEPSEVVAYTTYSNSPHNPSPPGSGYDTAYRSTDSGASWSALKGISRASALLFDPAAPDTVLVSGENSLYAVAPMGATPPITDLPECCASTLAASRVTLPVDAVPPPAGGNSLRYFAQTRHTLGDAFLAYWTRYSGMAGFGLPLTEPFIESGQTVQYFERAALTLGTNGIQMVALGRTLTAGRIFPPVARLPDGPGRRYFPATGHGLSGRFLAYWRAHQGATVLGSPLSEPIREANGDGTGRIYLVQFFEDGRLEYHPEAAGTPFEVEGGQLGREALRRRGWL